MMQKHLIWVSLMLTLFTLIMSGCAGEMPISNTLVLPTVTVSPIVPTTATTPPPRFDPGDFNLESYLDPLLNFNLRYPATWTLEARDGAELNDGSGRTVKLERAGYVLEIKAQFRPENPGDCTGSFHPENNAPAHYWRYQADAWPCGEPKLKRVRPIAIMMKL